MTFLAMNSTLNNPILFVMLLLLVKLAKNVYDHEKAQKLWMYLVDDAAKEYVKEFGTTQDDVSNMFPKETREQVARVLSDRELENIKQGEYDAPQGTVS